MSRTPARFVADTWQKLIALILIVPMTALGLPLPAVAAPAAPLHSVRRNAMLKVLKNTLASAKVRLLDLETRARLEADAVISRLHEPDEFTSLSNQFEEPLIPTGPTSGSEDSDLRMALDRFRDRSREDDFSALEGFANDHPHSSWRVALLTNLGLLNYHYGYFSKAVSNWSEAWTSGKSYTDPKPHALVDRAVAELARMHARLGHADALEALFRDIGDRKVTGSATEILTGAHDGLWMMRHDPGVSYLCGPMALKHLLLAEGSTPKDVQFIDDYRSSPHGVTLEQVSALAERAGFRSHLVYRSPGEPVPLPSVVHWKVNHFATLLGFANGRYHVQDPTFGTDLWITPRALDAEASGYFLVSQKAVADEWIAVSSNSAKAVFGMGYTNQQKPGTSNCNSQEGAQCTNTNCNNGLCDYGMSELTVSLNLTDTPVGYTPPKGPAVKVSLSYNQREDSQPATFAWFNVGPKWTLNFLTYIEDDPLAPGSVSRYVAGGGSYAYYGYSSVTNAFAPETNTGAILAQTTASPIVYTRSFPDGHREIYSQSNGATSFPRLVFLSKVIDPAGNALTFNYDSQLRLITITDATGRNTTFSYELAAQPLSVTSISDPFGRCAHLSYDSSNRLNEITDVLGLKSQFTYDTSSLINSMKTPYGTTTFTYSDSSVNPTGDVTRYLNATDPLGNTERMEYRVGAPNIPYADPSNTVPTGMATFDAYLYYRDSFHWDKHAYAVAAGDYTMANQTHWCHWAQNTNYTSDFVESGQAPLENRVWYNYEGQGGASYISGAYNKPTAIGRVLDDATSQVTNISYNSQGNVTQMIDPVGRETQFTYAPNGIDLVSVQQKASASGFSTIAQFTYNFQHLPLTYTDAAGQVTQFAYNTSGQLTQMTDALGEATQYQYNRLGYLTEIINANGKTQASFKYDRYGDVATATDSEGYTVRYTYDSLDRVTGEIFPDTTTRKYAYTNLDLTSVTDRQNNTTQYAYDSVRNLVSVTDPLDHVTKLAYWENKSLKSLTDPNGNTTNWSIDVQNRVTDKEYADGSQVTNAYEGTTSRLKSITDALQQVKTFTYGEDDTLTNIDYTNTVNPTPNVTFAYDPYFRRITSMTDGNGTRNYTYQAVGSLGALQLAKESGPYTNDSIAYAYDQLSRLTARTVDTSTETFVYDKLSRLIRNGTALGVFNLSYLGQTGQIMGQQISTGTVGTIWKYDTNMNDRRLKTIINSGAARSFHFRTTPENLITKIRETSPNRNGRYANNWDADWTTEDRDHEGAGKSWDYKYDDAYRLTDASSSAGTYAYALDPADNITSFQSPSGTTDASYNDLNQIVNYGRDTYDYDKNGNVLDDGLRTYTWDAERRLLSIASKTSLSQKTTFSYDGLGRRTSIITTNNGMSTANRYLWCGETPCQERTAIGAIERRYYSEGEFLPLAGTSLYYSQDQLGSVRDALATQNGSRIASFDYDPYGNPSQSNGRISTDFRYAGLLYDQQDALYLTHYRVYDPRAGRWLSRDPIVATGGTSVHTLQERNSSNLYSYVNGGVTFNRDLLGLSCESPSDPAPTPISLGYTNLAGGPNAKWWTIQWNLSRPSSIGGWIVQKVVGTLQYVHTFTYWEAWYVNPGYATPNPDTDTFSQVWTDVTASAQFYEGLSLPDDFTVGGASFLGRPFAGILRSTWNDPNLSTINATAPVIRSFQPPF